MQETPETELLKISEAAQLANVSRVHVWRLVRDGEIPAVRVGVGHDPLRINAAEFRRWLYSDPERGEES
jgi:excisionase family DNA binding protein